MNPLRTQVPEETANKHPGRAWDSAQRVAEAASDVTHQAESDSDASGSGGKKASK
jgi:hypothetical protein